jgi:hypothetical protein
MTEQIGVLFLYELLLNMTLCLCIYYKTSATCLLSKETNFKCFVFVTQTVHLQRWRVASGIALEDLQFMTVTDSSGLQVHCKWMREKYFQHKGTSRIIHMQIFDWFQLYTNSYKCGSRNSNGSHKHYQWKGILLRHWETRNHTLQIANSHSLELKTYFNE